nr:hypothetical protein [Inquilinus sp. Marseille-Q2685]
MLPSLGKCSTRQSTAIWREPTPRKPPKSTMAARVIPARSTTTSTTRPRSSPEVLRTDLPSSVPAASPSITTAGVSEACRWSAAGGAGVAGASAGGASGCAGGASWARETPAAAKTASTAGRRMRIAEPASVVDLIWGACRR